MLREVGALVGILCTVTACSGQRGLVGTKVESPVSASPGRLGFGTGKNVSGGNKTTTFSSDAVIVAAGSSAHGPTAKSEGDIVWRVQGGVLELCEWADDGRDDCRYATYEGFAAPPLATFLPTIIEPGNLASGGQLAIFDSNGARAAEVASVARHKTKSVRFVENKSIWVTASTPAILGAQPVFLCAAERDVPVCRALPFVVSRVLGSLVVEDGGRKPVLWVQAGLNGLATAGIAVVTNLGVFRCEGVEGVPKCAKAKEVVR